MSEVIKVGIAAFAVCSAPDSVTTIGLGSCVGVVLYDEQNKIAGLVHIMLPDSTRIRENSNEAKFADTGVKALANAMLKKGAVARNIKAKIAGGAKMFEFSRNNSSISIGEQNIQAVRDVLKSMRIPLLAEDVGLDYGRTIYFDTNDWKMKVKSAGREDKVL